ncbi:MAG: hypothetical protein ABL921_34670 [Pirellula sp.]
MMLVPVPSGLSDPQFQFQPGAVDAIVVHPPSVGGPSERVHSADKKLLASDIPAEYLAEGVKALLNQELNKSCRQSIHIL